MRVQTMFKQLFNIFVRIEIFLNDFLYDFFYMMFEFPKVKISSEQEKKTEGKMEK